MANITRRNVINAGMTLATRSRWHSGGYQWRVAILQQGLAKNTRLENCLEVAFHNRGI
jgi:hypothetical protein